MNDSPDVSVVMSVYNGADHLPETLDSILAQEGVALELIVVNDGSTDQSGKILAEYASRDERVRVIPQENQGLTKSLIRGCSEARGKYIARHDVGDTSDPLRLAHQKQALDAGEGLAFVSCWTEYCGPEWEHLYSIKGTGLAKSPTQIVLDADNPSVIDGPYHHGSVMFRKNSYVQVGGYRKEFYYAQDWDLWYRLAEAGTFQIIEETLYHVRVSPGSISTTNKEAQEKLGALALATFAQRRRGLSDLEILAAAIKLRPDQDRIAAQPSKAKSLYFIGECLRRNGDRRSLKYFKQSIQEEPLLLRSWIRMVQCFLNPTRRYQGAESQPR